MIIGIALVVDELHKGQRLVYRYPESVPSSVLNSTEGLLRFHQEYQSLSPDNFAKLFRPKASLFNKILELTIDDLHYISFPCPCSDELSADTSSQTATDVITLFNVVIATVRDSAIKRLESIPSSNPQTKDHRSLFSKNDTAGSDPVAAALGLRSNAKAVCPNALRRVVETISRALLNQEKRNRYVSKQVALMLRLQDEAVQRVPQIHKNPTALPLQSNFMANDNAASKRVTSTISNIPSNETTNSGKKKNRPSESSQSGLTLVVPAASEAVSRTASLVATPTSRSHNALESAANAPPAVPPHASSSGVFYPSGIWIVSPQRVASPPLSSTESGSNPSVSAERDVSHSAGSAVVTLSSTVSGGITAPGSHPTSGLNSGTASITPGLGDSATLATGSGAGSSVTIAASNNVVSTVSHSAANAVGRKPIFDKKLEVMECMQVQSSLANELRLIYHGLIGGHSVHLMINNSLTINIRLTKAFVEDSTVRIKKSIKHEGEFVNQNAYCTDGDTDNGYLTLLTIADKEEMTDLLISLNSSGSDTGMIIPYPSRGSEGVRRNSLGDVPRSSTPKGGPHGGDRGLTVGDASATTSDNANSTNNSAKNNINATLPYVRCTYRMHPDLEDLLSALDPTVSLDELSVSLEQPLREVFNMCRHLQRWGLGSFIPAVTSDRKYKVNPRAPTNAVLKVTKTFNSVFQKALQEASKYLEAEIEKLEKDESHESLTLNQPESENQKLIKTAKDRLNNSDDSNTSEMLKNPRSSNHSRTYNIPISTSPPRTQAQQKSMFNFSHLNHPNGTKSAPSNYPIRSDSIDIYDEHNSGKSDSKIKIILKNHAQSSSTKNDEKLNPTSSSDIPENSCHQKPCKNTVEYTLPFVLAAFDGNRTLEQAIRKLPLPLQPYGVDITVWLLRWKMIEEVNAHVISLIELERMFPQKAEGDDVNNTTSNNNFNTRTKSFDDVRDEFKTSAFTGAGISAVSVAGAVSDLYDHRDRKKGSISIPSAACRSNNFYINLSEYEQDVYSRLTPYFDGALPLHEIAWRERLVEEDIFRLLKRNPDVLVYQA